MKNYNSDFGDCENCRNLKMNKRSRTQIDASKKDDEARKRVQTHSYGVRSTTPTITKTRRQLF